MNKLPLSLKKQAVQLRIKGYSIAEISNELLIAKSTAWVWTNLVALPSQAIERLNQRKIERQKKSKESLARKKEAYIHIFQKNAEQSLKKVDLDANMAKLLCSLIYYCEGVKGTGKLVTFVNSDASLVKLFLALFRKAFTIDESKFRILMHLHEYHNEEKQKNFWSLVTGLPSNQFIKTFWKANTKKRIREQYPGCVSIRYHDAIIAKELLTWYKVAASHFVTLGV